MPPAETPLAPSRVPRTVVPAERGHANVPAAKLTAVAPQSEARAAGAALADPAPIAAEPKPTPVVAVIPPAGTAHGNAPPRKLGAAPQGSEGPRAPAQAERGVPFAPTPSGRTIAAPAEPGYACVATPKLSAASPQGELPAVGAALADPAPVAAEPRRAPVVAVVRPAGSAHANAPPRKLAAAPHGSEGPRAPAQAERAVPLVASAGPASVGAALADPAPVAAEPRRASSSPSFRRSGARMPMRRRASSVPRRTRARGRAARASGACHAAGGCGRAGRRRRGARRSGTGRRAQSGTGHYCRPAGREPACQRAAAQARCCAAGERGATRARASRTLPRPHRRFPRGSSCAPAEPGHASVATPKLSAVAPQGEGPAVGAALADPAPLAVALAPVGSPRCNAGRGSARQCAAGKARRCAAGQRGTTDAGQGRAAAPGRLAALPPPNRHRQARRYADQRSARRASCRYAQTGRPQGRRPGRSGDNGDPRRTVAPGGAWSVTRATDPAHPGLTDFRVLAEPEGVWPP